MEILDEGLVGVNEHGQVFACNRKMEELTGIPRSEGLGQPAGQVYPFIPFDACLREERPQPACVVGVGEVNMNVAVTPVLRGGNCIGAFATVQRFSDAENRQNELRTQLHHKGYRAKYTFADVRGDSPALRRCITMLNKIVPDPAAHPAHRGDRHRKGAVRPLHPPGLPPAPPAPLWPSTAPPCRKTCWRASCSATRRGPLPGPGGGASPPV